MSTRDTRDNGKYREIDRLQSADGLVGIISQRIESGVITFAIIREFPQAGTSEPAKTSFIPEHLGQSYIEMTTNVINRIAEIRKNGEAPQALRTRRG